MKTNQLIKQSALFLSIACMTACGASGNKTEDKASETITTTVSKPKVRVETIKTGPVDQYSTFTATLEADVVNRIAPSRMMRIKKIYVDVGSRVKKGDRLVKMDLSSLAGQNIQIKNIEKEYTRIAELLKVGGASQQQADQLKTQLEVALESLKNLNEDTYLLSPINGIITERNYDDGDVFGQNPILTVQQMNPVKALINVSESFYTKVKNGMPVEIQLDLYGDEKFNGKVSLVYPIIDPTTHTFTTEVKIANGNLKLRPGMFSRVIMNFGTENRAVVPDNAIVKQPGSNDRYVYVVKEGIAQYVKVVLGQRLANKYEIVSGLNNGDVIVTTGQSRLSNNVAVEIVD